MREAKRKARAIDAGAILEPARVHVTVPLRSGEQHFYANIDWESVDIKELEKLVCKDVFHKAIFEDAKKVENEKKKVSTTK